MALFPGEPWSVSFSSCPPPVLKENLGGLVEQSFSVVSVIQLSVSKHWRERWPGLVLASSTTRFLTPLPVSSHATSSVKVLKKTEIIKANQRSYWTVIVPWWTSSLLLNWMPHSLCWLSNANTQYHTHYAWLWHILSRSSMSKLNYFKEF